MPGLNKEDVDAIFTFHPPKNEGEQRQHESVREACREAAIRILYHTPVCPEQTTAIRKLQEAMMHANAAIAIHQ